MLAGKTLDVFRLLHSNFLKDRTIDLNEYKKNEKNFQFVQK